MSGHADDLGGAECIEAVDEGDADLDFCGLVVGVSCGDAFTEGLETAHLRLDPASGVVSCPAVPECPAIVPGGAQGFVVGACCRAVLFPRSAVLADRDDRGGLPVDDRRMTAAGVICPIGGHGADLFVCGNLAQQLRQDRAVAFAAGGELHRPNVRSGRVGANAVFAKQRETAIAASTETQHPDIMTSLAIAKKFAPGRTCSHTSRCSTTQNASTRTTACCRPPSHRLLGNRLPGNG